MPETVSFTEEQKIFLISGREIFFSPELKYVGFFPITQGFRERGIYNLKHFTTFYILSRPRWSRGTVLASRSKVRWLDGFFQDVKSLSTSPPGGTLSWVSRV